MANSPFNADLTPWAPSLTSIPKEWETFINELIQQSKGMIRSSLAYALNVKYNSQRVGDQLRSWGLPWPVVVAGYLREYDNSRELWDHMPEGEQISEHIKESIRYARYIEEEALFPLITPPYDDLGALLMAIVVYYQALTVLKEQSKGKIPQGKELSHIESVLRTLLHIAKYLGMWHFKREIEDLTEQLCHPKRFAEDQQKHQSILSQYAAHLKDIRQSFQSYYQETTGQPIMVSYVPCSVAGLKRRTQDVHTTATTQKTQLTGFDLVIFDITVPIIKDCYTAFGVFSQLGAIQDRVSDYIAHPKLNGYSHLSFRLILSSQTSIVPADDTAYICTLQIATPPLQAIMYYGCLYPVYYNLYSKVPHTKEPLPASEGKQFWHSSEGRVYYALQGAISRAQHRKITVNSASQDSELKPMVVYDINRNPVELPIHTTALDFAYEIDTTIGERAIEAIVNNRPSPLSRKLDTGDVVEIRISQETQVQEHWLIDGSATTPKALNHLKELLRRRLHEHHNYQLIRDILDRHHYSLTIEQLEQELHLLVTQHKLGTLQAYLEQLDSEGEEPWTPEWTAQQVMRRHIEHIDAQATEERHWIPVPLSKVAPIFLPRHLCGACQPVYPHTQHIVGLVHKKKKVLVIHSVNCPRLSNYTERQRSRLLPMVWQYPPPAFKVAFLVAAQDRRGLVNDITRRLYPYQSILLSLHAETTSRFKKATIRLTIETHDDREVLAIWDEMSNAESVLSVEIDSSATLPHIYERLQHLYQRHQTRQNTPYQASWETSLSSLGNRSIVLKNPYDISRPATKNMFFGRSTEMNKLYRELCDGESGKALVLYGPRRSGKSSLCKNFLERYIAPPYWHTLVSLQGNRQQNEEAILNHIADAVCRTFHEQLHRPAPTWPAYDDSDPQTRFKHILQDCLAQVSGSRLILALDEFGGALEAYEHNFLEPRFFTYWRELISELPQLSLLFALPTHSHAFLTSQAFSNAFSFTESLPLAYLDRESAERLLVEPLREQQIVMYPNAVAHSTYLTGGNPYYLALLGQQLIFQLNQDAQQQYISKEDLDLAVDHIIEAGSSHNFLFHRKELQNDTEARIVEAIVDITSQASRQPTTSLKKIAEWLQTSASEIRPHLERLRNGLILNEYRQKRSFSSLHYALKIELVRHWMAHNRWFFTL